MRSISIVLSKEAYKFLVSQTGNTKKNIDKALDDLLAMPMGNKHVVKMQGEKNVYRYKIDHFRIIFSYDSSKGEVKVLKIGSRTDVYK